MSDVNITSPAGARMLNELPQFYESIYETRALVQTEGVEVDDLSTVLSGVVDQAFVDRATWGLSYWEEFLGIATDIAKPYDQRRSVIKSKIRGTGTVTVNLLKKVVSSYQNGEIDVVENPSLYQITVRFSGILGSPPNIGDVYAAVSDIIPAHLEVVYTFRYLSVSEVEALTIDQLEHTVLDYLAWG
ncbi:putative phage tail protein [Paenibacillus ferrarius]|uniref:putative phage tail protein n=1 Tax=Paenibacillus ferrarius TaxID=1469647 RepID=UPI003D2A0408